MDPAKDTNRKQNREWTRIDANKGQNKNEPQMYADNDAALTITQIGGALPFRVLVKTGVDAGEGF
jgi:hypothetical protein